VLTLSACILEAPDSISITYKLVRLLLFLDVLSAQTANGKVESLNRPRPPLSTFRTFSRLVIFPLLSTLCVWTALYHPINQSINRSINQSASHSIRVTFRSELMNLFTHINRKCYTILIFLVFSFVVSSDTKRPIYYIIKNCNITLYLLWMCNLNQD
jgi:hypothetical protein